MGGGMGISEIFKALVKSGLLPGGKWQNDENTVFVSGLPPDTTNADLLAIFSPFGAIAPGGAFAQTNPDGTAKGSGIINFLEANGAGTAVSTLNNASLPNGAVLKCRSFNMREKGS
uniref:RRM domain-containing protein n=2 Tax=Alexandrium catenella TaxID=2925 RepID=A0A7S1R440_ALECA